jgi:hypothetical protein
VRYTIQPGIKTDIRFAGVFDTREEAQAAAEAATCRNGFAVFVQEFEGMTRHELLCAIREAHKGHNLWQGGNFLDCDRCRLHIAFRDELTWLPPRARKERPILTLEDVKRTVRS